MKTTALILLSVLTLAAAAFAVDPPPDGGYPNANTAEGEDALFSLTTGTGNTAIGFNALFNNATSSGNTAEGQNALFNNTLGGYNTANGALALYYNTVGVYNTANGAYSLFSNRTGSRNTANGMQALLSNTGSDNTANGFSALLNNTTGRNNTALGNNALFNNATGNNNTALGAAAGINLTNGSNNVYIGAFGATSESNTIRIGRAGLQTAVFVTGIWGATAPGGAPVVIDGFGHLGTLTSSARYKDAIKPMDKASEAIFALQPVTFHYKKELDPKAIPQFGLVAEQVAKIDPDLVGRDEAGKPYTVRYEAVNAMLLNEFLKAHQKAEQQEASISELKVVVAAQQELIKALASQIKTVSNRLEANGRAPQIMASNQ